MKVSELFVVCTREKEKNIARGRDRKDKLNKCCRHVTDSLYARMLWRLNLHYFRSQARFYNSFQDTGRNNKSGVATKKSTRLCTQRVEWMQSLQRSLLNSTTIFIISMLKLHAASSCEQRFWRWSKPEAILRLHRDFLISQYLLRWE